MNDVANLKNHFIFSNLFSKKSQEKKTIKTTYLTQPPTIKIQNLKTSKPQKLSSEILRF